MSEIPKAVTRLALPFSRTGRLPLVGPTRRFFNTPMNSRAFLEIPYYEAKEAVDINGMPATMHAAEGDETLPELANYIQRLKREAVIIAAARFSLREAIKESGGRAAIAATIGDLMIAGVFPNGLQDLGQNMRSEYQAALRVGTYDFRVGLGAYRKKDKRFVISSYQRIEPQHVPIAEFDERYPDVPLV